jgi:hypothetical protein
MMFSQQSSRWFGRSASTGDLVPGFIRLADCESPVRGCFRLFLLRLARARFRPWLDFFAPSDDLSRRLR